MTTPTSATPQPILFLMRITSLLPLKTITSYLLAEQRAGHSRTPEHVEKHLPSVVPHLIRPSASSAFPYPVSWDGGCVAGKGFLLFPFLGIRSSTQQAARSSGSGSGSQGRYMRSCSWQQVTSPACEEMNT